MLSRNLTLLAIFGVLLVAEVALGQSWTWTSMGGRSWTTPSEMAGAAGAGGGGSWAAMPAGADAGGGWAMPMAGGAGGGGGWDATPMGAGTWSSMAGSGWARRK